MSMPVIAARWFTPTNGRSITHVVVHSMEAPNKGKTAEAVGNFFAGLPASNKASAHVGADQDSLVRYVADKDVAFAAPGLNAAGLHLELAGYARYTAHEWAQPQMLAMLALAGQCVRDWCATYGIPLRFVDAAGLKRGERGITTHYEVSQAFRRSDHWDPGPGFPIRTLITAIVNDPPPMAKEEEMAAYFQLDCPTGGYWIVKRGDGGVFAYEGAPHFGALPGLNVKPQAPIVAMEPYVRDDVVCGYWLLGADGGVYSFGEAPFTDSYAGHPEWHQGRRQFVDIEQHDPGYDLISVVVDSDPPERNVYDLSQKR